MRLNAQTDTTRIDTTSFSHIDSVATSIDEEAYFDTTVKHIYDTSEYFFNWKKYYNDPYAYEKIQKRSLPDSAVRALKNSKDFWYIPAIEKIERRIKDDPAYRDSLLKAANQEFTSDQNNFVQRPWFNMLLWIIIIGIFLAALVYFLAQNKINLFSKKSLASATETSANDENADIFHLQYTELLRKAEKEENYRGAVRLLYLQSLKLLSEAGLIQYQPDYTNLQYVQQLYKEPLYDNFFTITRHYEFVWYGKFDIAKTLYEKLKNDFLTVQSKVV